MRRRVLTATLTLALGLLAPEVASARATLDLDLPDHVAKGDTVTIDGAIGGTGSRVRVTVSELRVHRWHTRDTAIAQVPDRFRMRLNVPDTKRYGIRVRLTRGGRVVTHRSRIWNVRAPTPMAARVIKAVAPPLIEAILSIVALAIIAGLVACAGLMVFAMVSDAIAFMLDTVLPIAAFVGAIFAVVALLHH
jgi:hypothetical protein